MSPVPPSAFLVETRCGPPSYTSCWHNVQVFGTSAAQVQDTDAVSLPHRNGQRSELLLPPY